MTGVEIATLAIAAAGLAAGTAQGVQQHQSQRKGLAEQKKAQQQAGAAQAEQQKANQQAAKAARAKRPDILELLAANIGPKTPSTVLTGPGGLGSSSSLGV